MGRQLLLVLAVTFTVLLAGRAGERSLMTADLPTASKSPPSTGYYLFTTIDH